MASAVPLDSSIPPPGSRPLTGSKHVLSVDKDGHGHLVTPPSSREDLSEASSIELKQAESSNAPTSTSTASNSGLLTENELAAIAGNEDSEDLKRVVQHAIALENLRQVEKAQYLFQLEEAKSKIDRLESELATLPAFYTSSSQLELARLQGENDQLTRQSMALARKLRSASTGKHVRRQMSPDYEDDYYNDDDDGDNDKESLGLENRKLLADVRHLEHRLNSSQNETSRLTAELRRLRSYYLQGAPLIVHDAEVILPPNEASKPGSRAVLLGDAEAELLLQAGKTHSHVRRIQRIPLDQAIQEQAEEIVQAIVPFPVDPPLSSNQTRTSAPPPSSSTSPGLTSLQDMPTSFQLPVPPSLRAFRSNADFEPGPGFNSISSLHAAPFDADLDSLPVPPPSFSNLNATNAQSHFATNSLTRNGVSANVSMFCDLPMVAPIPDLATPAPPTQPRTTARPSAQDPARKAVPSTSSGGAGGKPSGRTPSALDLLSEAAGAMHTSNETPAYNPRSRKPKLDANGEKKARSPYIKWNVEEDEQLLRAVIECGLAWDNVAKLCPTREYHQVRQRFLRGLKSGETLPPELVHLQPAVKQAVFDYESRKKRKKTARHVSVDSQNQQDPQYRASQEPADGRMQNDGGGDDQDEVMRED